MTAAVATIPSVAIDPFSGVESFPYLNTLCDPLRVKHKMPFSIPLSTYGGTPQHHDYDRIQGIRFTAGKMVYSDWSVIAAKAEQWLKDNYPAEFVAVGGLYAFPHPSQKNAMNHGGSLGADFFYWQSESGMLANSIHMLSGAYAAVVAKRASDEAAKVRAVREAEILAAERACAAKKLAEKRAKLREDAIDKEVRRRLAKQAFDAEVERRMLSLTSPAVAPTPATLIRTVPYSGAGLIPPNVVELCGE